MPDRAYVYVFDGFADWEPALALCAIKEKGQHEVVSVSRSRDAVVSRGGLTVVPDVSFADLDPASARVFLLPGGDLWDAGTPGEVDELLPVLRRANVPVAAICGATTALARAGEFDGLRHTSNGRRWLARMVPGYKGAEHYVDALAITDGRVISASGAGHVEFGREIIRLLDLYNAMDTAVWFDIFKHGVMPPEQAWGP